MAIHQPTTDVDFADQEILAASQAGDKIALEILYRWYAPRLLKFCQNRLRNLAEAEDAAHETILKAYAALPTFRDGAKIWPWLATIASNVCTDIQRRQKYFDSAEFTEPMSQDFQEAVDARTRAEIVNVALTELPSRYQTLVYLRDFSGLSYEQIAQKLDTSVATVRSRLLRGRSMLRLLIRRVAKQRGHWPLPIVIPAKPFLSPADLWRRSLQARTQLKSWWLRLNNSTDGPVVAGIVNAIAITALMTVSPMDPSTSSSRATLPSSQGATVASLESTRPSHAGEAVHAKRTKASLTMTHEATPPYAVVDVNKDGEPDTGSDVGPIRIDCSQDPRTGTVSGVIQQVACPALSELE